VSDIDTVVVVDGPKALDPKRPIREATELRRSRNVRFLPVVSTG
jgi:predicted nuclease with RNAse H fold